MKRIFIALKVDAGETFLKIITSLKFNLKNESIKWTNPGNIHITLAFLGDTEEETIERISSGLNKKCEGFGGFELLIKGSGVFKNLNDPRVIWTGIEPSDKLTQLNRLIMNGLKESGVEIENRPFNPHLTLGRIKHINDKELLKKLMDSFSEKEIQIIPVNDVILYESILLQTGPVYRPLVKFKL